MNGRQSVGHWRLPNGHTIDMLERPRRLDRLILWMMGWRWVDRSG